MENDSRQRLERLRETLPGLRADALLIQGLANIRYLTGFTGSNAQLLVAGEEAALFTDGRYKLQARQQVAGASVVVSRGPLVRVLVGWLQRRCLRRLAFEKNRASYEFFETLREGLPGVRLVATAGAVEKLRAVKSQAEIETIRRAVQVNSAVFERSLRHVGAGQTESEIARQIDHEIRRQAEKPAFDTIVLAGVRTALPHGRPDCNSLKNKDLIIIDQGAILKGYSSDMTRTVALGGLGGPARRLYRAVLEAQLAAIAAIKGGVKARAVDRAARIVLKKHGLEKAFLHSTGHGVGLEIHEAPRLAPNEQTKLEAGMVVTVEPGAYVENMGGVRIEDMVVVTATGCEVLTPTPKDLRIL